VIKIINDDFRNNMDEIKKAKIVVTDPPYNIKFKYASYKDNLHDKAYIELIGALKNIPLAIIHYPEETMKYIVPALGVPDEVVVWCYNSNLPRQSRLINFFNADVDFKKVVQPYKNMNDKRVRKLIEGGAKGTRSYDWFSDIQLVKNVSKDKHHPCPVPVKLMERIIMLTTNEGDTVVDPFSGSGTTAIACRNTNRNFVGYEIDLGYYNISVKRIADIEREGECQKND
jgi:site-specific DNA-methyltransferase (adenine-specific)